MARSIYGTGSLRDLPRVTLTTRQRAALLGIIKTPVADPAGFFAAIEDSAGWYLGFRDPAHAREEREKLHADLVGLAKAAGDLAERLAGLPGDAWEAVEDALPRPHPLAPGGRRPISGNLLQIDGALIHTLEVLAAAVTKAQEVFAPKETRGPDRKEADHLLIGPLIRLYEKHTGATATHTGRFAHFVGHVFMYMDYRNAREKPEAPHNKSKAIKTLLDARKGFLFPDDPPK